MPLRAQANAAESRRIRAGVASTAALHDDVLESRGVGRGVMAAPKKLTRRRGEYVSSEHSDYDWFYTLSRREQARLRENWFAPKGHGEAPDEVADRMPIHEWLEHTRHSDAGRAVAKGRSLQADRYGGLTSRSLVRDQRDHPAAADGTRFYTDANGVVHPIAPPKRATTAARDYGADEAF